MRFGGRLDKEGYPSREREHGQGELRVDFGRRRERSGLSGGGQRRGRQPDAEPVGRTLRSVWYLGGRRAAAQSVEHAERRARRSAWARQQAPHTSAAAEPCPGRVTRGRQLSEHEK